MSVDQRIRTDLQDMAEVVTPDTWAALEGVKRTAESQRSRRTLTLAAAAAAAAVAGVVFGPGIVSSLSDGGQATPVDQPTDEATVDDGTDEDQDTQTGPTLSEQMDAPAVEPGTYTLETGPVPVTFTTEITTFDPTYGDLPYRFVVGDPSGQLVFDFPFSVADLSQEATAEGPVHEFPQGDIDWLMAGPIDMPADVGAWLNSAVSLDVVDEGALSLADGDASWWDVEVSNPQARCFEFPTDQDPCVVPWPWPQDDAREQWDRQAGQYVIDSARVYSVEVGSDTLTAVAYARDLERVPAPEDELERWLATTDEIVSSITLE